MVLDNVIKIRRKIQINDAAIIDKCKALQSAVKDRDWFEVKTNADINGLMEVAANFHDSYVKNMYVKDGKRYIRFDTTWGCEILFELDGNVDTNLFKDFGLVPIGDSYPIITDSSMFFENNLIFWVDDKTVKSCLDLDKSVFHYFCANTVKWKLIIQ